jgi:glycosyltransferase involved in cell wall biosynthesis
MKHSSENLVTTVSDMAADFHADPDHLCLQLRQAQADLAMAEKILIQIGYQLRRTEQSKRAAQSELWCIHNGRWWKMRTRLVALKNRLLGAQQDLVVSQYSWTHDASFKEGTLGERPNGTEAGRTILVIDARVPEHDREAGALRLFYIFKMMRTLNYSVLFFPDDGIRIEPYATEMEAMGIRVLDNDGNVGTPEERLCAWLPWVDIAWISRPEHYENYAPTLWQNKDIKLIYDTVDLHFLRLQRGSELFPERTDMDRHTWEEMRTREIRAARSADMTVVVTDVERQILQNLNIGNIQVVPTIHEVETAGFMNYEARAGLLFIGGPHSPNVDGVQWLCREVMPLVWQERPDMKVTLLGSKPAPEVLALADERISVPGFIPDVSPYFNQSRVFVAPLRYGAGMKGKVGQSLGHGLPCVLTSVAAEGIGLTDGQDALIADTAEEFAAAILRLYRDAALWSRLSESSFDAVRPFSVEVIQQHIAAILTSLSETVNDHA